MSIDLYVETQNLFLGHAVELIYLSTPLLDTQDVTQTRAEAVKEG